MAAEASKQQAIGRPQSDEDLGADSVGVRAASGVSSSAAGAYLASDAPLDLELMDRDEEEGEALEEGKKTTKQQLARVSAGQLPPIPALDQYLREPAYLQVRNSGGFEDWNLSDAAAGFVSYQPMTMLFRRNPAKIFTFLIGVYQTGFAILTWPLYLQEVESEKDLPYGYELVGGTRWLISVQVWLTLFAALARRPRLAAANAGLAFFTTAVSIFLLGFIWEVKTVMTDWDAEELPVKVQCGQQVTVRLMAAYVFLCKENQWRTCCLLGSCLVWVVAIGLCLGYGYLGGYDELLFATIFSCGALFLKLWRERTLRKARLATKPDQRAYDEVWEPLALQHREELRKLAEVVKELRHTRVMQPFYSLEQIFQRGYSLDSWFQEVIAGWAAACGARHQRGPVKSLQRTQEKIMRSYRGRIPPVIDVVRATIVVEDIRLARTVLEHVIKRTVVHQVKNRFDLDYNAEETAGYRDLNCHISFKELLGSPFEGFVFELQIHYAPILAMKNDQAHKRYILLRNLRGD